MHIPNDVERPMLRLAIVVERLAFDRGSVDFFRRRKLEDVPYAFALQTAHRAAKLLALIAHNVWTKLTVGTRGITVVAQTLGQIEDDGNGMNRQRAESSFSKVGDSWKLMPGTKSDGDRLLADAGRVLGVTALGRDLAAARERAYRTVDQIDWPGGLCRRDIGARRKD